MRICYQFVAIYAFFVATTRLVQNTRSPRHFWGGSQALSTFIDVCTGGVTDFDISTRLMTRSPISSTQIDSMNSPAMSLWFPALRMALCVFGLWQLASYSDRLD